MKDVQGKPISANSRWAQSEPINAIKVSPDEYAFLYLDEAVVSVRRGIVLFRIKMKYYYHTVYKKEMLEKINFEKVVVRYDLMDLTNVHLYTLDNIYLESIPPSPRAFKNKFANSDAEKADLKYHKESKDTLLSELSEELEYYKKVVAQNQESNTIPIELLSPYDEKDDIDAADKAWFLDLMDIVEDKTNMKKATNKKSSKKKSLPKISPSTMKEAAKKYQHLN